MKRLFDKYWHFLHAFLVFAFVSVSAKGQSNSEYSYRISPFIRNITKTEYQGANQSWSVSQANDGFVYVANRLGLLEYDGSDWKLFSMESIHPLRSVLATDDGRVYYGHFEDFGYFMRDNYGQLNKVSLSDSLILRKEIANENIWSINKIGDKMYFRSFGKIYIYDGNEINVISPGKTVFSLFEYKNLPYINLLSEGLFYLDEDDQLQKESCPSFIEKVRIIDILPYDESTDLVITEFNGIYLKSGENYSAWECEANTTLKDFQQNKCVVINENLYAIGTIGSGIIMFNKKGEITSILDKINGLQNNTVLALSKDKSNNLWVCLDKGIDYIEINSPFLFCLDRPGSLGAVYSAILFNEKLYIGTNQGLYYTEWDTEKIKSNINFEKIDEAQGQVWELTRIGDKLICNYNLGVLQIDEKEITQISSIGGFTSALHPNNENIFYQGSYSGVLKFNKGKDGNWKPGDWMYNSIGGARFLHIDQFNNLWVGNNFKNARLIRLDAKDGSMLNWKELGAESGFNPRHNVGVFSFENTVIFSNYDRFFTYDHISESVKPYQWLNKELGHYKSAGYVYKTNSYEYWFAKTDQIGMFVYDGSKLSLKKEISYNNLRGSAVDDRQNIWKIDNHEYVVGLDNGFMIYDSNLEKMLVPNQTFRLTLVKANCSNKKGQQIDLEVVDNAFFDIPYRFRNLVFNFAMPGSLPELYSISFKLDEDEWTNIGKSKSVNFNYLRWGNHKLTVKAIGENDTILSQISYKIHILPPWYLSVYAFFGYLLIISGLVFSIIAFNRIRLKKQKLVYLKKIKSDNTRRIIKMKNQYLRTEVQNKSAELVNYTVLLGKKNKVLINIKELLDKWNLINGNAENNSLKQIYGIIERNLSDKNDWKIFSTHFDEAHSNFLRKIKIEHPALTPNDLQLCAFLKMNLSSKEIAALLNISLRSMEVKRYRLRKKLYLDHDENLVEYLLKI